MPEILRLAGLCLAAALLELDATSVGQWMLSRPVVLGGLLGSLAGRAQVGWELGAFVELFLLADLPIGGAVPLNGPVAAAVAVLAAAPPRAVAPEFALPLGLVAGWLYRPAELGLRQYRAGLVARVEDSLAAGRSPGYGRTIGWSVLSELALAFAFLAAAAGASKLIGTLAAKRASIGAGAVLAWKAAPVLVLVAAVQFLFPRRRTA